MATILKKPSTRLTAQQRTARKAEEAAKVLHSFATALNSLSSTEPKSNRPTPRNWWKVQAGRFKDDPTFSDFVAQIQSARKLEG
jgi:hypothetical protein